MTHSVIDSDIRVIVIRFISLQNITLTFIQGTTKKAELKDDRARARSKSKVVSSSDNNAETSKKLESNHARRSQAVAEHRGDGDRSSKVLQSSVTSRMQSTRNAGKQQPAGSSQLKSIKQNHASSMSKSSSIKGSSSHSTIKSTSSRTRSENVAVKSNDDSTMKRRKSREQAGYSEKRGVSTVYMPKSTASKLNIKSSEKTAAPRATRGDSEKSRDAAVADRTKSRMPSRERRKSRTLSPSEIRMLHSAAKRPDAAEKVERQRKGIAGDKTNGRNAQADSDEADYDYEDDFEVKLYPLLISIIIIIFVLLFLFIHYLFIIPTNCVYYYVVIFTKLYILSCTIFQDYESDFQECTDSETSPISEKSDSSGSNSHLEPIELQTREKVLSVISSLITCRRDDYRYLRKVFRYRRAR